MYSCCRALCILIFIIPLMVACFHSDGGGGRALEVTVSTAGVKTIQFDWSAYSGANNYKLFVNPDGASGYTLLQDDLLGTSTTLELPVHLTDWINASYILEAHDGSAKLAESTPISITDLMSSSIGNIQASNTDSGDRFGYTVSLSADGNTLAIGASYENSNATGINGDETDNSAPQAGAVYIFTDNSGAWSQQAYIKASNTDVHDQFDEFPDEFGDRFGTAVSLSNDGNTLAVGASLERSNATGINGDQTDNSAPVAGAVYIFTRSGSTWTQQAYIKASNTDEADMFGAALSLSNDGNALAVGAFGEKSIATGVNGDQTDNSAIIFAGAMYIFTRSGSTWTQQAYIKASNTDERDHFGRAVNLSDDGNTLAVGAFGESSNATGINGDQTDNSAERSGAVYVFTRSGDTWTQQAYVKASNTDTNDLFGFALSLSNDGNTLAVGAVGEGSNATGINGDQTDNSAPQAGAVYVFTRSGSTWTQQAYIKPSYNITDNFGPATDLSADGNTLAVGAYNKNDVFIFTRSSSSWTQASRFSAGIGDVSLSVMDVSLSDDGMTLAVGLSAFNIVYLY